jgi:hypothetical protein
VLLLLTANRAPAQPADQGLFWFKFPDPKANEAANKAVGDLSTGLADLITSFNGGRKTGSPVDSETANTAIGELKRANDGFYQLTYYIGGRKIDRGTIDKSGNSAAYYDLVNSLRRAGYQEPVDGKTYVAVIQGIINHLISDVEKLRDYSVKRSIPFKEAQQLFFDAITQKVLLEKLGVTSGIISIAMQ